MGAAAAPLIKSTEKDRTDLMLAVYNDNYAFNKRETLAIALKGGDGGRLEFIGGENAGHIPAKREVRLKAEIAFDVTAKGTQKRGRRPGTKGFLLSSIIGRVR